MVRIGHDGRGLGTGWFLEEVMIIVHDECWVFPCMRWLADYEDDGKVERELRAGGNEILCNYRVSGIRIRYQGSHCSWNSWNSWQIPGIIEIFPGPLKKTILFNFLLENS